MAAPVMELDAAAAGNSAISLSSSGGLSRFNAVLP